MYCVLRIKETEKDKKKRQTRQYGGFLPFCPILCKARPCTDLFQCHFSSCLFQSFLKFICLLFLHSLLRIEGAASTRSFASFKPRPSTSFTTLITAIFCAPASVSSTLNELFSSASAAPGPATAATAAADTPNFFSKSFTSSCQFKHGH